MIFVRLWFKREKPVEIHEGEERQFHGFSILKGKQLSEKRYCIGYDIRGKYQPHGEELKTGYQCESCRSKDIFFPCTICNGTGCRNKKAWDWCDQPFVVYMAYFGGKQVKVGVTAKKRVHERLREQGAIAFSIQKESENGLMARRTENVLKRTHTDRMILSQKLGLYKEIDLDWFENRYGLSGVIDENKQAAEHISNQKLLRNPTYISNEDFDVLGNLLIFRDYLISFKSIRGRKVVKRTSLFDF
jgi:hypothetical protein